VRDIGSELGVAHVLEGSVQKACTENADRLDLETESLNVGHDGSADISPFEPGWLAPQVEEPSWSRECRAEVCLSLPKI
jgi:hypothetical protein